MNATPRQQLPRQAAIAPVRVNEAPEPGVTIVPSLILLVVIATWLTAGLPGFTWPFLYGVLVAAAVRVGVGMDGRRLVLPHLFLALASTLGVASVIWIVGLRDGGQGATIVGLLCVVAAFQSLLLLGSLAGTRAYVIILLSSVQAVGTAFLRKDLEALLLVVAYAVALTLALLYYERRHAITRPPPRSNTIRRVRQVRKHPLPWRVSLRTLGVLVLAGFPLAALFMIVVPPAPDPRTAYDFTPREEIAADSGAPEEGGGRVAEWSVGPSEENAYVPRGNPAKIKQSHIVFCEVVEVGVPGPPTGVYLRDNVQDVYSANGDWRSSGALRAQGAQVLHPEAAGWFTLPGTTAASGSERHLAITLHRNAYNRWFLQPHAIRARLLRDGTPVNAAISYSGNETLALRNPRLRRSGFEKGDVIEQVFVGQARSDQGPRANRRLRGRQSNATVSPLPTYVALPATTRAAVAPVAARWVGSTTDPWDRARLLEQALKNPPFEYVMAVVPFEGPDDMADFFGGNGRGACGRYATALVTLLRSLGHPARYARGFWGGEPLGDTTVFSYAHYHAWCELYLEGVGWVALNPTPPDRNAADREVGAHALDPEQDADKSAQGRARPTAELLVYDREDYRAFWGQIGRFFRDTVGALARSAFGPRTGFAGLWTLLGAGLYLVARRRHRRLIRLVAGPHGRVPKGLYGRTLLTLAKRGIRRLPHQTARELWRAVILRFPDAAEPLDTLTTWFEGERYGGHGAAAASGARQALRDLALAIDRKA